MKKYFLCAILVGVITIVALSFRPVQSNITGKVSPADGAEAVWAIGTSDSSKASINGGSFSLQVKPGVYKVLVDAKEPRKDVVLDNIEVKDQPVDVGEIVLQ